MLDARLKEAMMEDIENGLYPFFVSCTLGTTGCCAFDRLDEIGPVCKVGQIWETMGQSGKMEDNATLLGG